MNITEINYHGTTIAIKDVSTFTRCATAFVRQRIDDPLIHLDCLIKSLSKYHPDCPETGIIPADVHALKKNGHASVRRRAGQLPRS